MDAVGLTADLHREVDRARTVVRQTVAELTVGRRRPTAVAEPQLTVAGHTVVPLPRMVAELPVTGADLMAGQLLRTEEADQHRRMAEAAAPADLVVEADTRHRAAGGTVAAEVGEATAAAVAAATVAADVTKSS